MAYTPSSRKMLVMMIAFVAGSVAANAALIRIFRNSKDPLADVWIILISFFAIPIIPAVVVISSLYLRGTYGSLLLLVMMFAYTGAYACMMFFHRASWTFVMKMDDESESHDKSSIDYMSYTRDFIARLISRPDERISIFKRSMNSRRRTIYGIASTFAALVIGYAYDAGEGSRLATNMTKSFLNVLKPVDKA